MAQYNLSQADAQAAFREFSPGLSAEEELRLSGKFTQYLFYDGWGMRNFRECICTSCGAFELYADDDKEFFRLKHGDAAECPRCGATVQLYALGRMQTGRSLRETQRVTLIRAGKDGAVLLTSGWATKDYCRDDLMPTVDFCEKVRTYLRPGAAGQWKCQWDNLWGCREQTGGWQRAEKNIREPFISYMYSGNDYWLIGTERIADTALRYCRIEDWYHAETGDWIFEEQQTVGGCVKFLAEYAVHPQIEMAVKMGLSAAVTKLINGRKNARDLDWSAARIDRFLRLTKPDAREFIAAEGTLEMLREFHSWRKLGEVASITDYLEFVRHVGKQNFERLRGCAAASGVTMKKALRYAEGQNAECARYAVPLSTILQTWADYLDLAQTLGYDLTREDVRMPRDLKARHDAAAETLRVYADKKERMKYSRRRKILEKLYAFSADGMMIRVPQQSSEIIAEGKVLEHCVGGYAARHIEGKCVILFLRREDAPDEPLCTIEMDVNRKDKIIQIHGYRNEMRSRDGAPIVRPMEQYGDFIRLWLGWVSDGSRRRADGTPLLKNKEDKIA